MSKTIPPIGVPASDMARLRRLALHALNASNPAARFLLSELDRATPYEENNSSEDVVRVDQWVTFRADTDATALTRMLVAPEECLNSDIHLSVVSLVGAALLGLRVGASMPYRDKDGIHCVAIVESLAPPSNISFFRPAKSKFPPRRPADFDPMPDPDPGPSAA